MSQTFARVIDNKVVEVICLPDNIALKDAFHPDVAEGLLSCNHEVMQGWTYDGEEFAAPLAPPITKDDLIAHAADKRYAVETGGIVINGMAIMTDRQSQSLITGAYSYVKENPDITVRFKTMTGFVELTAPQMANIANTVAAHVQANFATEAVVAAEINAGTTTTFEGIDAAAWPTNS